MSWFVLIDDAVHSFIHSLHFMRPFRTPLTGQESRNIPYMMYKVRVYTLWDVKGYQSLCMLMQLYPPEPPLAVVLLNLSDIFVWPRCSFCPPSCYYFYPRTSGTMLSWLTQSKSSKQDQKLKAWFVVKQIPFISSEICHIPYRRKPINITLW